MKNFKFIILAICIIFIIPSCSTSSKTSVDPWPGLFKPKETNKNGVKKKKKRDKQLEKSKKRRLSSTNFMSIYKLEQEKLV